MSRKYTKVLGVKINSVSYKDTLRKVVSWISKNEKKYVCVSNVHSIMECQKNAKLLKGVNDSALVCADGMPLVWLSKIDGRDVERVYGPTLMEKICGLSEKKGYRVFFLGGVKGTASALKKNLAGLFPKLKIAGLIETPAPLSKKVSGGVVKRINKSGAQIVFVGMGCPRQELWMIDNRNRLEANVLFGVGAAFDFTSGRVRQAPAWVQNLGFEWLFRLSQEPKRLWRRYTITNLKFLYNILPQIFSISSFRKPTSSVRPRTNTWL